MGDFFIVFIFISRIAGIGQVLQGAFLFFGGKRFVCGSG